MRILLVKLTSMGDLIQALPAVSDLARHLPEAQIDWVVDQAFAEIPRWHPAIRQVHTTDHRGWFRRPLAPRTWKSLADSIRQIRRSDYDLVIDLQNNYKSALVTSMARGISCGPDRGGTAEPWVHLLYRRRHPVTLKQLAIHRWRDLLAGLFGYSYDRNRIDFQLADQHWQTSASQPDQPYLVFVINASWDTKLLPAATWTALAQLAHQQGLQVLLTWGNAQERHFAEQVHAGCRNTRILPKLALTETASLLRNASGAICNDTGLAHLAAALQLPTLTCYGPTDPRLIAATGVHAVQLHATGFSCAPCYRRDCARNPHQPRQAACLASLTTGEVWEAFTKVQHRC